MGYRIKYQIMNAADARMMAELTTGCSGNRVTKLSRKPAVTKTGTSPITI